MALNCKPGDLARIVGTGHPFLRVTDRLVRIKNEPQHYIGSDAYWSLEAPLTLLVTADFIDAKGVAYPAGRVVRADAIADEHLRPIRDPGDDSVDETLIYAGDPRVREQQRDEVIS